MDFGEYWQVTHLPQPKLITNTRTELDLDIAVHSNIFCFCANKCECKPTEQEWMLDSGASLHFTGDINDFVDYTPLEKQVSVRTANSTASIEGKGTIIIVLHSGNSVRISPVYYIPTLTCKLLSLGTFLQEEFRCTGSSQAIRVMKGSRPFLTFFPRTATDSIYVIKSMAADKEGMYSALGSIYKVDYETVHNRLAHPSKDVITKGWKHLKDFPKIEVPTENPLCPGCAQGKMTNRSFPATPRRASQPFQLIHSDLKSLPIESY